MTNILLTFSALDAGDLVASQFEAQGVKISTLNPHTPAIVFDTSHPTGGDTDLASSSLGNVLILSEDGDRNDPDDNAGGGTFVFDFAAPTRVLNFETLDIEERGGEVRLFDAHGALIKTVPIEPAGDNQQGFVNLFIDDVARMEVELAGSGAIDNICFAKPILGDGIVEGSNEAELIDAAYLGDPEGDRVDADDAILPGQSGDEDIIDSFGGDDTIRAGAADDSVFAGSGGDDVKGGAGNDTIYGDSNYAGPGAGRSVRESLKWSENRSDISGFTQDTGAVEVTFATLVQDGGSRTGFSSNRQNIDALEAGDEAINARSALVSVTNGQGSDTAYALDFSDPVENLSFRINDIDGDGVVSVRAFDADGNAVELTLTGGDRLLLLDNDAVSGVETADSTGGYDRPSSDDYSALVEIPGPLSRIEINHVQDGPNNTGVFFTDVFFDVPLFDDGLPGNDRLDGGAGDDVIFGEGGDDTILGGAGADEITGGAGADTQFGDDDADSFFVREASDGFGDVIDGGTGGDDRDTLDLTGAGPLRIVDQTVDADGDSTSGRVEFLDSIDGAVIGTLDFKEIETLVPCFTPGTTIATPHGEVLIEELEVGDKVITRDNGIQEVRWVGSKHMDARMLQQNPHLQPILIAKESLGNGLPERDMLVSPNHRVLVNNDRVSLYFEENEVLVAAKFLENPSCGVHTIQSMGTNYIHFMCDNHEVVLTNGSWTESFQPGDHSLRAVGNAQRNEIFELFPELRGVQGRKAYASARLSLKKHEAQMLFR
ncbi:MAG: Hint domain-containing protein [Litoreibacter sp.]|nr:Hint domain-containing protein [Litoreibacter sp.]